MFQDIHSFGASETKTQLILTELKVNELLKTLQRRQESFSSAEKAGPQVWTTSYENWDKWNEIETLNENVAIETKKAESLSNKANAALHSHSHDHSEERKIFEMKETDKIKYCEYHRAKGNYLFHEGLFPKAAEQYQLALSYYEYCFPEAEAEQAELASLRLICLCNLSACYYRQGFYRNAAESATLALKENPKYVKALYRRSKAYKALDEYGKASLDLETALSISPSDVTLQREIDSLKTIVAASLSKEKLFAASSLGTTSSDCCVFTRTGIKKATNVRHENTLSYAFQDDTSPLEPINDAY